MGKHLSLLVLTIVFCAVISFGQTKQNCTVFEENILDRQICGSEIKWKDSHVVWLLPDVFYSINVPAGISIVFTKGSEKETVQDFTLNNYILRDVLNKVITVQPQYQWKDDNGIINIYPTEDYAILDMRIPYFKLENGTISEALYKLIETNEFTDYVRKNNLRQEDAPFFGGVNKTKPKVFSFNLKNPTIREILNEIVKANRKGTWMYGEYESPNSDTNIYRLGIY